MKEKLISIRKLGIKYSFITSVIFIAYFLAIRMTGLINMIGFRFFNYSFFAIGIFLALRELRQRTKEHNVKYLRGIVLSFIVILFTSLFFAAFIFLYTEFIDISFLGIIRKNLPYFNGQMSAIMISIYIFSESFLFGLIMGLIVMQIFKRNLYTNLEPEEKTLSAKDFNNKGLGL